MVYEIGVLVMVAEFRCEYCGVGSPICYGGNFEDLRPDDVVRVILEQHSEMNPTYPGELVLTVDPRIWWNGDPYKLCRYRFDRYRHN